jgi:16S rRNA (uracil1498-N3)-methyltransferase
MTTPRFFLPKSSIDLKAGIVEISKPDLINQMRKVLRLKPNDPVVILDGEGSVYQCGLIELSQRHARAKILESNEFDPHIRPRVTVFQSLLRGGRFDWVVQKLTELGVSCIVPLICEHGVAKYSGNKLEHWQEIAREAAEQCERTSIPQVVEPKSMQEVKESCLTTGSSASTMKLLCLERSSGNANSLAQTLLSVSATKMPPDQIDLMIGPEGGFTEAEIANAQQAGFIPVSLGERILRSETAAIAAMAVLIALSEIDGTSCGDGL